MTALDIIDGAGGRAGAAGRLTLKGVGKRFSTRGGQELTALDDVCLQVGWGEFVAIVGPSGCGKTTLLKLIAGMIETSAGSIDIEAPDGDPRIGFVFQQASLYPWRTLIDNVAFGLEMRANRRGVRRRRRGARTTAAELLELVGLAGFERYYPAEVSGGMQQRANLARALAIQPSLLLMDEPFSALDAQTREELQIELQRIAIAANATTVFVTHDIREAAYLADRVVVLSPRPGRIKTVVEIPHPRPRPFEYQVSAEFQELTNELWHLVHTQSDFS